MFVLLVKQVSIRKYHLGHHLCVLSRSEGLPVTFLLVIYCKTPWYKVPDLARTLDTMPVTFAKMGLPPSFKLQYGLYGWCLFSPGRVLNDIGQNTTPASIP